MPSVQLHTKPKPSTEGLSHPSETLNTFYARLETQFKFLGFKGELINLKSIKLKRMRDRRMTNSKL